MHISAHGDMLNDISEYNKNNTVIIFKPDLVQLILMKLRILNFIRE